ncbi:MAG: adenylosuccinate lyase [Candidatus Symbiobacter sp.]|nr:adenylosuccinate lyase [Candidatus Symbiobacter sp.]
MIPRYSRPELVKIWQPENRYKLWLEIEILAAEKMFALGIIPEDAAAVVRTAANQQGGLEKLIHPERIDEIERETKHDVIAFLTSITEQVGESARFLHYGMTSSDVLDTSLALQLTQASDHLLNGIDQVLAALHRRAHEHKYTPMIGRSHGIHAEPTSFGLKLAGFYAEFQRNRERLVAARHEIATCKISGAVGTYAHIPPDIEEYVAAQLGLQPETIATQVIPRDRHAAFFAALGVIASSIERLATEIRHLQRSEVGEVMEKFTPGQKGSSAMPHKRNPILSENLCGLARMVRSMVTPALENVALWHERDISHSSVERMIAPDATITLDFALARLAGLVDGLEVFAETMRKNMQQSSQQDWSQDLMLFLVKKGAVREDAYRVVQKYVFRNDLDADNKIALIYQEIFGKPFDSDAKADFLSKIPGLINQIDYIFARVFR